MPTLSTAELFKELEQLEGWELVENSITKTFIFNSFQESVSFVNRIAELSGPRYPQVEIDGVKVKLSLSSYIDGGVTEKEIEIATKIEKASKS